MKFKEEHLREQFNGPLHPAARGMAGMFDDWCRKSGYGDAIITSIGREPAFYPDGRFSWHLVNCAVDFRNLHLTKVQRYACEVWLAAHCPKPEWELVLRDHGTASHFHLAFRDFVRRRKFNQNGHGGDETPTDTHRIPKGEV